MDTETEAMRQDKPRISERALEERTRVFTKEDATTNDAPLPFKQLMALMTGLILAAFLASLDQTIVSTALPAIASSFDELSLISWVGISYLLTSTAFQPLYGKFSDIFGRKAMMLFAIIVFTIGSVLCGAAQSMIMLIVCRAIAGLGGAGLMSMSMIIISEVVPPRERAKYQSAITGVFAVSYVIGPLLGGVFTDHVSWRWAFYINLPIGAITVTTSVFCIQLPPLNNGSFRDKIKSIDFLGVTFFLGSITCILLSTCWGGSTFPWQHPIIITLYAVGGVLLGLFILVELRYAKQPIIPPYLFATRNVALSFIANFFIGIGFFGILFYMPLWYQVVRDASATTSGINIMPMSLGIILFSAIAGWSVSLTDYCRPFILAGAVLFTLGTGLLSLLNVETPYGVEAIILTIIGIGVGLIMQTLLVAAQSAATPDNLAAATTCCSFFRSVGNIVGLAICSAVFNNRLAQQMHERIPNVSEETISSLEQSIDAIRQLDPSMQAAVVESFVSAFKQIYIVCAPLAGMTILLSLPMKRIILSSTRNNTPMAEQ